MMNYQPGDIVLVDGDRGKRIAVVYETSGDEIWVLEALSVGHDPNERLYPISRDRVKFLLNESSLAVQAKEQPSGLDPLPMHHKRTVDYSE